MASIGIELTNCLTVFLNKHLLCQDKPTILHFMQMCAILNIRR